MSRQRGLEGSGGIGSVAEQERAERDPSTQRRKDKAKAKDDEKQEKRRLKEEERQRREREKEKERERKRNLKMKDSKKEKAAPTLEDVVMAEGRAIPLFLETCVKFIEAEGLDSEGIYRVPGNRAHVDMLFQKLEEGCTFTFELIFIQQELPFHWIELIIRSQLRHSRTGYCSQRRSYSPERFL